MKNTNRNHNGRWLSALLCAAVLMGAMTLGAAAAQSKPAGSASQPAAAVQTITVEEAKAKALAHAGLEEKQVTFTQAKQDWDDGRPVYEVEFRTDTAEYEYELDAATGEAVSFEYELKKASRPTSTGSGAYIGEEKARSIAIAQVSGAAAQNVSRLKLDYDDRRPVYEVTLTVEQLRYEFELDAYTGTLLAWGFETVRTVQVAG